MFDAAYTIEVSAKVSRPSLCLSLGPSLGPSLGLYLGLRPRLDS